MLSGALAGLLARSWSSSGLLGWALGGLLASSGVLVGVSWGSLGGVSGVLGALLASLSVFMGAPEGLLGLSLVASALLFAKCCPRLGGSTDFKVLVRAILVLAGRFPSSSGSLGHAFGALGAFSASFGVLLGAFGGLWRLSCLDVGPLGSLLLSSWVLLRGLGAPAAVS